MNHWLDNAAKLLNAETDDLRELAQMVGADPRDFYRNIDIVRLTTAGQNLDGMTFANSRTLHAQPVTHVSFLEHVGRPHADLTSNFYGHAGILLPVAQAAGLAKQLKTDPFAAMTTQFEATLYRGRTADSDLVSLLVGFLRSNNIRVIYRCETIVGSKLQDEVGVIVSSVVRGIEQTLRAFARSNSMVIALSPPPNSSEYEDSHEVYCSTESFVQADDLHALRRLALYVAQLVAELHWYQIKESEDPRVYRPWVNMIGAILQELSVPRIRIG